MLSHMECVVYYSLHKAHYVPKSDNNYKPNKIIENYKRNYKLGIGIIQFQRLGFGIRLGIKQIEMERELELKNEIEPRSVKYIICNPNYRYLTGIFCAIFSSIRTAIFAYVTKKYHG